MDEGSRFVEVNCITTKRKTIMSKATKMVIVDLDNKNNLTCDFYNKEYKNFMDKESLHKDIVIEDCLSEPVFVNRTMSENIKNKNSVEDISNSTNSSITSRSDTDYPSPSSLPEEYPKEILHLEFIEKEQKSKTPHLTSDEMLNANPEPEKRRTRRRWQLNKVEKLPKRNRPFSSTCYPSDRLGKENERRLLEGSDQHTDNVIGDQPDLINFIKDSKESYQDENKPKMQLQRSRTWTIIRRSKPLVSVPNLRKKMEEEQEPKNNLEKLDDKSSFFTNEESDSSSSSLTDKTSVRKQWGKPLIEPEFMVSKTNENNEDVSHQDDTDDSQMIRLNMKKSTAGFTCLNKHPSLLKILSSYSTQCVSKLQNNCNEENLNCRENVRRHSTGMDDETDEENEVWNSCREHMDEFNDEHKSCESFNMNNELINLVNVEEQAFFNENLPKTSQNEEEADSISSERSLQHLIEDEPQSKPVIIVQENVENSCDVTEEVGEIKELQMVSDLEEVFHEENQITCELKKTRSRKLAWPFEALDDALGTLKKEDSTEKSTAMQTIGRLAIFYPEIAEAKQLILIKELANEIKDRRPYISRLAVVCVLSLFSRLNFNMVQCIIETYDALLSSLLLSDNEYLKHDFRKALEHLTGLALPQQTIQALLLLLDRYENEKEREIISHLLLLAVKREDGMTLLQTHLPLTELLLNAAAQFTEDSNIIIRANGQKLIGHFDYNPTFKTLLLSLMSEGTIRIITPLLQENI